MDRIHHPGLLSGIPISVKGDVTIKGHVACQATSNWLGYEAQEDSALIKVYTSMEMSD